ncbi:uncharacterized protein LOC128552744 [Mercenaria mercenaria]|uniref:uncharacterized protein LOC128552744 n=1 Tax=Mercenaria mercenaria TaxID=6596 RepID=UPI00234F9272|nr:uncharacterized protein LOC128552744 [Mercenaria mercenaria]
MESVADIDLVTSTEENNDISEMELTTDNRSPDMSFENDADGIPVEGNESILDISLRLHDYGQFRPVPSIIRHQCQQAQPHTVSVSTQTDETRIPKTTSTQTPLVETASNGCQATRPAFTFEDVTDDNSKVLFFTGIPNAGTFKCLFDELESGMKVNNLGRPKSLRLIDEFFLVLMRLRLGLLLEDLAFRFHISVGTCSTIFNRWVNYLDTSLSFLVKWPTRKNINDTMPQKFSRKYPKCRVIIDCTEIRTETPCSLQLKSLLYSDYKSHMTWKSLIGISPSGIVTFVSDLYPGSISDKQITKKCGIVDLCEEGDAIMVDKGFLISDLTTPRGVELIIPPFKKKKKQFLPHEVEATKTIANLRIHVEREMERIKNFRIVQGTMPITMSSQATKIWKICVSLTNFLPPLVPNR